MITVTYPTKPKYWLPSANPIVFGIKSDLTNTYTQFSYLVDVIIDGSTVTRLKYPAYTTNQINIDIRQVVADYLDDTFINDDVSIQPDYFKRPEFRVVELKLYEQYWNGSRMFIDSANAYRTKPINVWRAGFDFPDTRDIKTAIDRFELQTTTPTYKEHPEYLAAKLSCPYDVAKNTLYGLFPYPPAAKQLIFKNLYKISPDTRRTLSYSNISQSLNDSKYTMFLNVWVYNANFELTKRFVKNLHTGTFTNDDVKNKFHSVPCGADDLNGLVWDNVYLSHGATPEITMKEDKYYFILICGADSFGDGCPQLSVNTQAGLKWIGFELVGCSRFETWNVLYKSKDGGWWQIRCNKKSFKQIETEKSIKYNTYGIEPQNPIPNSKRFKSITHINAEGSIVLNTDWIATQAELDEITDMIQSPDIYLVSDGNTPIYIPVTLKDSTFDIYNRQQDKLIQYQFEFAEAFKKITLV